MVEILGTDFGLLLLPSATFLATFLQIEASSLSRFPKTSSWVYCEMI